MGKSLPAEKVAKLQVLRPATLPKVDPIRKARSQWSLECCTARRPKQMRRQPVQRSSRKPTPCSKGRFTVENFPSVGETVC